MLLLLETSAVRKFLQGIYLLNLKFSIYKNKVQFKKNIYKYYINKYICSNCTIIRYNNNNNNYNSNNIKEGSRPPKYFSFFSITFGEEFREESRVMSGLVIGVQ